MAKIIKTNENQTISTQYSVWRIALVGAFLGVIYCGFILILNSFLPEVSSGYISTILIAILGIAIMVYLNMFQPLIIAMASGIVLWGLSNWTSGLIWGEVVAWSAFLYSLSYILFSWIARYTRPTVVVVFISLIVVIARVVVSL